MILTVTPDPVLDRIFFIEEWMPGMTMRASRTTTSVGGKGLDASVALRHLGQETTALAMLAGDTGATLAAMVEAYGIRLDPTWAGGETRQAQLISETKQHRHSLVFSGGLKIDDRQRQHFEQRFAAHLPQASWVICGGIVPGDLPVDFYRPLIEAARERQAPVLVDCFGDFMRACLPARPEVVKLNWQEFQWTFEREASDLGQLMTQMDDVYDTYGLTNLVVTCAEQGILARTPDGRLHAVPPVLEAVNAAGAGDAASGAIAWRRGLGDDWCSSLHWAAAVSAAVVLTEGTADCSRDDIDRIYPQVQVRRL